MNGAVKHGLIIGVISIAFTTLTYLLGPEIASGPISYLSIPIAIGLYVYFGIQGRKENGGYFTFGEAFKYIFSMGMIATVVLFAYNYVLFGIIDPDFQVQVAETAMEGMRGTYESLGMSDEQIDTAMEDAKANMGYSIKTVLIGLGTYAVLNAILAAIIGAIIKKQNPEEANF